MIQGSRSEDLGGRAVAIGARAVLFLALVAGGHLSTHVISRSLLIPWSVKKKIKEEALAIGSRSGGVFVSIGLAGSTVPVVRELPDGRVFFGTTKDGAWIFARQRGSWRPERKLAVEGAITGVVAVASDFLVGTWGRGLWLISADLAVARPMKSPPVHVYQMTALSIPACGALVASWEGLWCVRRSTLAWEALPIDEGIHATGVAVQRREDRVYWAAQDGRVFSGTLESGETRSSLAGVAELGSVGPGATKLCWWATSRSLLATKGNKTFVRRDGRWQELKASRAGTERPVGILECPDQGSERAWVVDFEKRSREVWLGLLSPAKEARWWATRDLFLPISVLDGSSRGPTLLGSLGRGVIELREQAF
jgi:hypothetical protein